MELCFGKALFIVGIAAIKLECTAEGLCLWNDHDHKAGRPIGLSIKSTLATHFNNVLPKYTLWDGVPNEHQQQYLDQYDCPVNKVSTFFSLCRHIMQVINVFRTRMFFSYQASLYFLICMLLYSRSLFIFRILVFSICGIDE